MKKTLLLLIATLSLSFANPLTQKLFSLSGGEKAVEAIPSMLEEMIAQAQKEQHIPKQKMAMLTKILTVFQAEKITPLFLESLDTSLSLQDTKKLITWLETDFAKKIIKIESNIATKDGIKKMLHFKKNFVRHTINEKRLAAIESLNKALNYDEKMMDMSLNVGVSLALYMMKDLPKERQLSREQLTQMIKNSMAPIKEKMAQDIYASFVFIYQKLSDHEIQKYVTFLNSSLGKKYARSGLDATVYSFTEISKSF